MMVFGIIFLIVALVLVGVGIAVGLVAIAVMAALVGLGAVSSSVAIGLVSKKPGRGVRAFVLQCGVLAGLAAGAGSGWMADVLFIEHGAGWPLLVLGAVSGALAGRVRRPVCSARWVSGESATLA